MALRILQSHPLVDDIAWCDRTEDVRQVPIEVPVRVGNRNHGRWRISRTRRRRRRDVAAAAGHEPHETKNPSGHLSHRTLLTVEWEFDQVRSEKACGLYAIQKSA